MPSEPTSRWRRFAAFVFAPDSTAFAATAFWLFVALLIGAFFQRLDWTGHHEETVVLSRINGEFGKLQDYGRNLTPKDERWDCVIRYSHEHRVLGEVHNIEFDVLVRLDGDGSPLGRPVEPALAQAREAAAAVLASDARSRLDAEALQMLAAGDARRLAWGPADAAAWLAITVVRALPLIAGGVFLVRAVQWIRVKRRHARCLDGGCPMCGYSMADLTTPTCPECGCDTSATCLEVARLLGAAEDAQPEDAERG